MKSSTGLEKLPGLNQEENNILSVKYQSKPVRSMNSDELCVNVHKILLKIHVITGWVIPANEMMDILIDQAIKKFTESYSTVNMDEIEFAFRNNTTVKDWGKNMNLAMIDEVMMPYLAQRREVSRIEEQQKKELPPPNTEPPMTDEEYIKMNYGIWLALGKRGMISPKVYYMLVKQGKINLTQDQKDLMYKKAELKLIAKVGEEKMVRDSGKKKAYDGQLIDIYDRPDQWKARVYTECKQMAVEEYFKTL